MFTPKKKTEKAHLKKKQNTKLFNSHSICAHHINHHLPQGLFLLLGEVEKNITVRVLEELEGDRQVVVLQHALVIVHQR